MEEVEQNNGIPTGYTEKVDPPRGYGGHLDSIIKFETKDTIFFTDTVRFPVKNVEYQLSTDLKGNEFGLSTQHNRKGVSIDPSVLQKIIEYVKKEGPYTVITAHNHPSGNSFSPEDITNFIERNFAIEARVSGKFYTCVIQKPKNKFNNLKVLDEKFNNLIRCNIDPNVKESMIKTTVSRARYLAKKWREEGDTAGIKLNEKFKDDPDYSIFIEATHMAIKEACKTFGIPFAKYETQKPENIENQEIKESKVQIASNDIVSLTEKKDVNTIERKPVVIDERYDVLGALDVSDITYEYTMFRKPYPFEDFNSFNKKKIQEKKEEYEKIGIDEKKKTIIETRNLTVRRKAKLKGETGAIGTMPKRGDYSYIPIGRAFGGVIYGITTFGGTGTNVPYSGERTKHGKLKYNSQTDSYNGWLAYSTKELQREYIVRDYLPGLKPKIECTKEVLPIFYNLFYDLHKSVEPLTSTSCFSYRNARGKSVLSCHASGTAIDFNHPKHPHHHANTFKPEQVAQIQKLIKRYGCRWGGNWKGYDVDDMHFEIWMTKNEAQLLIQKLNLVDRMNKIKSGINVPVE